MRRAQLEHAIRTACQIVQQPAVIVVGSRGAIGARTSRVPPRAERHMSTRRVPSRSVLWFSHRPGRQDRSLER